MKLPTDIGPTTNVIWKMTIPGGHSSPVVSGNRVYLTAVREKKLLTMAIDGRDGKLLWEAEAPYKALEKIHLIGSHAQSTPATDGERVLSLFGSCGLFCYDRTGKQLWHRPMGPFKNDFGAGSSPVIWGDWVLLSQDHDQDSFLVAFDKRTGKTVWKTDRSEFLRGYCTPVVWDAAGCKQVVVAGTLRVAGYDLATGKEVWTVRGLSRTVCMTPVVGDDALLYVAGWSAGGDADARIEVEPFDTERFTQVDLDKDGSITREEYERFRELFEKGQNVVLAVRPGGKGDVTETHVVWRNTKQVALCASPLYYAGHIFTVKDGGFLSCLDARNGKLLKRDRLPGSGNYYSSPVEGDGKVYLLSERGRLTVVNAAPEWKILSSKNLEEDAYATPAIVDGRIYVRTAGHLFCCGF
jgi:outer membrane protein assembly factor BamB